MINSIKLKDGTIVPVHEDAELTLGKIIEKNLGSEAAKIYYDLMAERDVLAGDYPDVHQPESEWAMRHQEG